MMKRVLALAAALVSAATFAQPTGSVLSLPKIEGRPVTFCVLGDSISGDYSREWPNWLQYVSSLSNGSLVNWTDHKVTSYAGFSLQNVYETGFFDLLGTFLSVNADVLVFSLGQNDTYNSDFKPRVRRALYAMTATKKPVVVMGVASSSANNTAKNDDLRAVATEYGVPFVDVWKAYGQTATGNTSDGTHPSDLGSFRRARAFIQAVSSLLRIRPSSLSGGTAFGSAGNERGVMQTYIYANTAAMPGYGDAGASATKSITTEAGINGSVYNYAVSSNGATYYVDFGNNRVVDGTYNYDDVVLLSGKIKLWGWTGVKAGATIYGWEWGGAGQQEALGLISTSSYPLTAGGSTGWIPFAYLIRPDSPEWQPRIYIARAGSASNSSFSGNFAFAELTVTNFSQLGLDRHFRYPINGNPRVQLVPRTTTINLSGTKANMFRIELNGNTTLGTVSGFYDGQECIVELVQDSTGSRTVSVTTSGTNAWAFSTTIASFTATTTASKRDLIFAKYNRAMQKMVIYNVIKGI